VTAKRPRVRRATPSLPPRRPFPISHIGFLRRQQESGPRKCAGCLATREARPMLTGCGTAPRGMVLRSAPRWEKRARTHRLTVAHPAIPLPSRRQCRARDHASHGPPRTRGERRHDKEIE
jgi:hypothetical protein